MLVEEFKNIKEYLEKKLGYKIYGGMPIVSKIIAMQLKEKRLNKKLSVEVTFTKIKGEKKVKFSV